MTRAIMVAMPALNEAAHIGGVIDAIRETLGPECTIVVVDDGSTDTTADLARSRGAQVIRHARTLGLGATFRDIVKTALVEDVDILVTIDADGQFRPREIPRVIEPIIQERADFVAGSRFRVDGSHRPPEMPAVKYVGNLWMNALISRITRRRITDASSGFRAYSREALLRLNLHGSFTYTQETFLDLATKNIRMEQIPVSVEYRKERRSRIVSSIPRYAARSFATILRTVRDHRPLLVFGIPSAVFCLLGICGAAFVTFHYLSTGSFSPYIFVMMGGAYLFSLGLIIGIVGVASDMLRPIRRNQEEMLYLLKKRHYGEHAEIPLNEGRDGTSIGGAESRLADPVQRTSD